MEFSYKFEDFQLSKELAAFVYNGFLVFSSTYESQNEEYPYNSILALFGYPYGQDEEVNISQFFTILDNFSYFQEDEEHNLYTYLMSNISLVNNIFECINTTRTSFL